MAEPPAWITAGTVAVVMTRSTSGTVRVMGTMARLLASLVSGWLPVKPAPMLMPAPISEPCQESVAKMSQKSPAERLLGSQICGLTV
jgi:hypothetical protein